MKKKRKDNVDKHFTYFKVLEALQKSKGCFFCGLIKKVSFKYLDALLYEKVNDGGVRKELLKSNGFCHRHAHELVSIGGALGIGIIYDAQMSHFLEFIDLNKKRLAKTNRKDALAVSGSTDKKGFSYLWFGKNKCPACRVENEAVTRYFKIFIDSLKTEKEMRDAFESSGGICVPHFLKLLDYTDNVDMREYLIEQEEEKIKDLKAVLKEFIRKQDYRFKEERVTRSEGKSWIDSVRMMTGCKDAF